jgi:hypothetical protein
MAIFVIFRVTQPAQLEAALKREFPNDHYKVADREWLVSGMGSARAISDQLGISEGTSSSAIVFKMTNYFGRAPTEIWDWIQSKSEKTSG